MSKRLQSYLVEYQREKADYPKVGRGKPLKENEAYKLIKSKCPKVYKRALEGSSKIWRFTSMAKGEYTFVDTSSSKPRMSLNTANFYTIIINNDSSWSAFPKRNVIASTTKTTPERGNFVLLPYDGVKIGVCSSYDIWMSFPTTPAFDAAEFNRKISSLFSSVGIKSSTISTIKALKAICEKFDVLDDPNEIRGAGKAWRSDVLQFYKGDLYESLVEWFHPRANHFELMRSGDKIPWEREVWFDGPSVWVDSGSFEIDAKRL
jgi:hypothetical protein